MNETFKPTLEEAKVDFDNTIRDLGLLINIVHDLEIFITQSGGEDRSSYLPILRRFQSDINDGQRVRNKIANFIESKESTVKQSYL